MDEIEHVIAGLKARAKPSSGVNLDGFEIDATAFSPDSDVFDDVSARSTDDPDCLIWVHATIAPHVETLQQVVSALRSSWMWLSYADFEASSCCIYREAIVLRFATLLPSPRLFVTGRVIVDGGPYETLVERFVRDFGRIPLPSLPPEWKPAG